MIERTPPLILTPMPSKHADAGDEANNSGEPIAADAPTQSPERPRLDPTRYGDWELNGKCVDF